MITEHIKNGDPMTNRQLLEQAVNSSIGQFYNENTFVVETGESTGRSPQQRVIVNRPEIEQEIDWGTVNKPMEAKIADNFIQKIKQLMKQNKYYFMKGFVGHFPIEVYSTSPWHIAFAYNMFRSNVVEALRSKAKDSITVRVWHTPDHTPEELGASDFPFPKKGIVVDPKNAEIAIAGTAYAGEIKKSAFSICNYLYPKYNIFPMHSSANCRKDGTESSILFGLSGTGKTTLSADPHRYLIGDDEIIWSDTGISNLEGGCYAKLIHLSQQDEPDIYKAIHQPGAIMENVFFDETTHSVDFHNDRITENTRGSYSIDKLDKVFNQSQEASIPKSMVFLTADAFGALPAVARLNQHQAQYHFLSGYTAKMTGTEVGVLKPEATFSSCFGAPFMPRPATVYSKLLNTFISQHNVPVYLLNTGWFGGYQKGKRFPISVSRKILKAIQSGEIKNAPTRINETFGFEVPEALDGIESKYLSPPKKEHMVHLAKIFEKNAQKAGISQDIIKTGGPTL